VQKRDQFVLLILWLGWAANVLHDWATRGKFSGFSIVMFFALLVGTGVGWRYKGCAQKWRCVVITLLLLLFVLSIFYISTRAEV